MITNVMPVAGFHREAVDVSAPDVAIAAVLVLAPLLTLIGIWIALESHGPVTLQRAVPGRDGKLVYVTEYRVWRTPTDASERPSGTMIRRLLRATGFERLPRLLDIRAGRLTLADALRR